jgi:hypothetical protein
MSSLPKLLISNPHPRTERADGGKILDSEADSLRRRGEANDKR